MRDVGVRLGSMLTGQSEQRYRAQRDMRRRARAGDTEACYQVGLHRFTYMSASGGLSITCAVPPGRAMPRRQVSWPTHSVSGDCPCPRGGSGARNRAWNGHCAPRSWPTRARRM